MRRPAGWAAALAVALAANLAALGRAWSNRAGSPDAVVRLTERELPVAYRDEENTGLTLRLHWHQWDDTMGWLDSTKLEALGFRLAAPADSRGARRRLPLPRAAYVALEYDGPAYRRWLAARARHRPRREAPRAEEFPSRLFAVDAALDPDSLRSRYPDRDRYVIAPAVVEAVEWPAVRDTLGAVIRPATIQGTITSLARSDVVVPRPHRVALERALLRSGAGDDPAAQWRPDRSPRYVIALAYGRRHEPWVAGVKSLPAPPQPVRR